MAAPTLDCQLRSQKKTMSSFFFIFFPFFSFKISIFVTSVNFPPHYYLVRSSLSTCYFSLVHGSDSEFGSKLDALHFSLVKHTYLPNVRRYRKQMSNQAIIAGKSSSSFIGFSRVFIANSFYLVVTICLEFSLLSFQLSFI